MATYTVPSNIDHTGATDVSAALLAFIATVPDGSPGSPNLIVTGAARTYRCDDPLVLLDRSWLSFDWDDSTIIRDVFDVNVPDQYHWSMERCQNIDITALTIRGPNVNGGLADAAYVAKLEFEHGFALWSCTDIHITDCQATKMYGDWVYLGIRGGGVTDGVEIDNCYFGFNGRQGFGVVAAHNVEIHHNTTGECRRSLMDFEPNGITNTCDNVWVHHNTFGDQRLSFIASKGRPGLCQNITVEDNTTAGSLVTSVEPTGFGLRKDWIIRRNVAASPHGSPLARCMAFSKVDGLTVVDNYQILQSGRNMYLAALYDCENFDVSGNTLGDGAIGQYFEVNSPPTVETDPTSAAVFVAPQIVESSTKAAVNVPTLAITLPVGTRAGDQILGFVGHRGTSFVNLLDEGWALLGDGVVSSSANIFYHYVLVQRTVTTADIAAGQFVFSFNEWSTTFRQSGMLRTIRGAFPTTPISLIQITDDESASSEIVAAGATTTVAGCLVVFFGGQRSGNATFTGDGEMTNLVQVKNNSSNGVSLASASIIYTGTGQGKPRTFVASETSPDYAVTVAFAGILLPHRRNHVRVIDAGRGGVRLALSAATKAAYSN